MNNSTTSEPLPQPEPIKNNKTNANKLMKMLDKQSKKRANNNNVPKLDNIIPNVSKVEKEKLILKILKYLNSKRFGQKLKTDLGLKYTRQQLLKCSNDNLEGILFRIRNYLNTQNMDLVFEHMARYSAKGYEDLVSNFYNIEGFSDLLMQNPAFWDAFERWKIEHEMPDIHPSMQLVYIIASTTYIAHLQTQVKVGNKTSKTNTNIVPKTNKKNVDNKQNNNNKNNKEKPKLQVGDEL